MDGERIQVAFFEGVAADHPIAVLALYNKEKDVNIFDKTLGQEVQQAVDLIQKREPALVVVCSRHAASFCHGADIKAQAALPLASTAARPMVEEIKDLLNQIENLPYPTVCCINATCLGGGLELALSCTYRFADVTCRAIGLPEVQLGILPGAGGCVRLPRLIGLTPALELIVAGKTVKAKKAQSLKLVHGTLEHLTWARDASEPPFLAQLRNKLQRGQLRHVPAASKFPSHLFGQTWLEQQLIYTVTKRTIDAKTHRHFIAPYVALETVLKCWGTSSLAQALAWETDGYLQLAATAEARSLMGLFLAKSSIKARSTAIRHGQPDTRPLFAFVVGAGWMGVGIGQKLARHGATVRFFDVDKEMIDRAQTRVSRLFTGLVNKHRMSKVEAQERMEAISYTTEKDFAAFEQQAQAAGAISVVLEAIPEDMALKHKLIHEVMSATKNTTFVSNTSSIPMAKLCEGLPVAEQARIVGVHYFHPEHDVTPVVEIIPGPESNHESRLSALRIADLSNKLPVTVGDGPAFILNRIASPFYTMAAYLLVTGAASQERIDKVMQRQGFPAGPFAILDGIGLKTARMVGQSIQGLTGETGANAAQALLGAMLDRGWTGRSFQGESTGFYAWKEGKQGEANPEMKAVSQIVRSRLAAEEDAQHGQGVLHSKRVNPISDADVSDALILSILNEACRALDEGVAKEPMDVDMLVTAGLGFPPQQALAVLLAAVLPLACHLWAKL
ncbi:uncharacterized protein MONBRDRAFT_24176 [Monosiga brevicollis MX1]|uniref:enoyl-CoA hydratase n=1 Tax=Monosiga brevicollis TaxID=81824 RepID=A9UVM1_MONBE|nr:uncharacterized protein MONBRDRAFT_24176 [Monosiga brevicollis MX1]EDQ90609.1 predicted protein [Monosiga brevicollis MX1]|eukprot:XP_001744660.1 hypothetical protein [Monosiga brevicollis MX1]